MKRLIFNELVVIKGGFRSRCSSRFSFKIMSLFVPELLVWDSSILCLLYRWEIK